MSTNASLMSRRHAAVVRGLGHATPVFAARAENAELWDVEGRRYIDFAAGIAVVNTGHRHPRVVQAVQAQLEAFTHPCVQVVPYEVYVRLAERLNAMAPFKGPAKSVFFTTGAEATENAIKIARAATGRNGVIAFTGGFHGRTVLASALTGKVVPYKNGLGSPVPEVFHAPFPNVVEGVTVEESLRAINFLFRADVAPSGVAAIILEPVQGEGGFHPAPVEFMRALRSLCDQHGIVLIADEVQTGFARTGKMFAMENFDVEPDLVCVAKGLAGGLPLSGVIGRASIMDAPEVGGLGGTFGGNPLSCAAALAVLDVIEQEGLLARARAIGARLHERLGQMRRRNDVVRIGEARGPGAMVAFDVLTSDGAPNPDATRALTRIACENGLLLLSCGTAGNTIRVLSPLTIPAAQLNEGLDILEASLERVAAEVAR
jgi:4-aminobutyrate aminotransferase/(S)-3-amino-2-methylpropionate transaminase